MYGWPRLHGLPSDLNLNEAFSGYTSYLILAFSLAASNVLQSEIARKAVDTGYDPVTVERTILERIRQTSEGYSRVEDLIQDITNGVFDGDSDMCHETQSKCSLLQTSDLTDVRYQSRNSGCNLFL